VGRARFKSLSDMHVMSRDTVYRCLTAAYATTPTTKPRLAATENAPDKVPFGDVDQLADQLMNRADADQARLLGPDGLVDLAHPAGAQPGPGRGAGRASGL
jgi:hypothetical protein